MKNLTILLTTAALLLSGCTPDRGGSRDRMGKPGKVKGGGVDVGNMTGALIPQTQASVSFPSDWNGQEADQTLVLKNTSGSVIRAGKSDITGVASPNVIGLQQHLKAKFPNRTYQAISHNGLVGVRADIVKTQSERKIDIYLLSEIKDFIHLEAELNSSDDGITSGESIIATVRVKYKGVALKNQSPKAIILDGDYEKRNYIFSADCYPRKDPNCHSGVNIYYDQDFQIGSAGYDTGRIVELGPETEVPFADIRIDGDFLVAPKSNVLIADIYTMFTPKDPKVEQDWINLREGYVYLIRTMSWPREDLITKMRVEKLGKGKSLKLTYQKLVSIPEADLEAQVEAVNEYTIKYEQPLQEGEVTLYNRTEWNNYFYASFNFEYSTSGNQFITGNSWNLLFENGCDGKPSFSVPHSGAGIGQVTSIGLKDIKEIQLSDFPDPNTFKRDCGIEVKKGTTYLIYHYDFGDYPGYGPTLTGNSAVSGAVEVLDIDPQGKWVRLKFRRMKVGVADHFQNWIALSIPTDIQNVILTSAGDYKESRYFPFLNKFGDQRQYHDESLDYSSFDDDYFYVDPRPFYQERGFYKLAPGTGIQDVTLPQVEALKGKFDNRMIFKRGDVFAVLLENYFDKTVFVMSVDEHAPGERVKFSVRFLFRAKAPYSDYKE